ncbi:MAG TPA: endolytic transglycosylase MltG [Dissulfurispiraceae bacterium]|nr:endolytic transglycosylase MltG [Dissulfurispiraceae bacterium]
MVPLVIVLCSLGLAVFLGLQLFVPTLNNAGEVEVQIPEGATFREAVGILSRSGMIRDETVFVMIGRITGIDKKIRAGFYVFSGTVTPYDVLMKLRLGRVLEYEITIVEGDSLLEIGKKLSEAKLMAPDTFNQLVRDGAFIASLGIKSPSLEGYLFPQTYRFSKGTLPNTVLRIMVQKLREEYNSDLQERTKQMGWSENEILTLASIIEKEAVIDKERAIISGVYHNRLKRGMPLQADPTAIYGVKNSRQKITLDDLRRETKYNTYIIQGLPPGPIASPGIKSIRAALYPARVPYVFFVAKDDSSHFFSSNLRDHLAAIARIRAGAVIEQKIDSKEDRRSAEVEKTQ